MQIKHLHHEHPLMLLTQKEQNEYNSNEKQESSSFVGENCKLCREIIWGPMYGCEKCNYFLCKPCVGYPLKIQHSSHHHPLFFTNTKTKNGCETKYCKGCFERIVKEAYACKGCEFQLHVSCVDLPWQTRHDSHSQHTLTLLAKPLEKDAYRCHKCKKAKTGFTFCCIQCDIYFDVHCASRFELLTPKYRDHRNYYSPGEFKFYDHPHLFTLTNFSHSGSKCVACNSVIDSFTSVYECGKCVYNFHYECAVLKNTIKHPFHPQHLLTLIFKSPYESLGDSWCNCCYKDINGFSYHCKECNFDLDVQCSKLIPEFKYEHHEHHLALLEKTTGPGFWCCACGTLCKANFYRCVACDFNVHPQCVLLPVSINHECHEDPLVLTKCYDDIAKDEFFCDACGGKRNAELNVYCCAECQFFAEIDCIFPGVIPPSKQVPRSKLAVEDQKPTELEEEIEKPEKKLEVLKGKLKGEAAENVGETKETTEPQEEIKELITKLELLKGRLKGEAAEHIASAILSMNKVCLTEQPPTFEREITMLEALKEKLKTMLHLPFLNYF